MKEATGALSGNKRLEVEGASERAKGSVREGFGEARRAVGEGLNELSRRVKK